MVTTKAALKKAARELEVHEPGSSDQVVSQQKLRHFEALEMELKALKKKFDDHRTEMKDVLKSGASVSTGRRGVESGIRWRRHPSYKQALIDKAGEAYQQKVLASTEYRPYFFVKFITRNGSSGNKE